MTVKSNILRLAERVDPFTKDGVEFTSSTVCTTDGQSFTSQRLLDIYNDARITLLSAAKLIFPEGEWKTELGGALVSSTITFTLSGSESVASKPTGLMYVESLSMGDGTPVIVLTPPLIDVVRAGRNPHYVQTASNVFAFDLGTQFKHFGTILTTASTYRIVYWGLTDWTLAQVSTGVETINDVQTPKLIEIAAGIARGMGSAEALTLAKTLFGEK